MQYLEGLNSDQRKAVEQTEGPVMIVAGPGSGKTRVLTIRIAHLLAEKRVDPFNVLALTFTNKAASEMRERIEQIAGPEARNIWMGTFHSVFARILRAEADKIGYPRNFIIYDTHDSKNLIKNIVKEEGLNEKLYKPNIVFGRISQAKNSLISPQEYAKNDDLTGMDEANGRPKITHLYATYAKRCFQSGAMDFDDLLFKMHELLGRFPEVLYKYQHRFRYILIDEYQDTNHAQYLITKKLADVHQNITIVGDDAQSIYSFRGANIQNILNFEKDYPELATFKLEKNYRSTPQIVNLANEVIKNNQQQLPKEIYTDNSEGNRIRVNKTGNESDEGRLVADAIQEGIMREHLEPRDFAILYRTNAQSRSFEEWLRKQNIAYRVYGGVSFYQRKEIKDFIAYMKLTMNHYDEESLRRVINYPTRGIGKTTIDKATILAREEDKPLWDILANVHQYDFNARAKNKIHEFVLMIQSFAAMADSKDAHELTMHIGRSSGLLKHLYNDKTTEGVQRYQNVEELLSGIKEFTEARMEEADGEVNQTAGLAAYLQEVTLLTDMDTTTGEDDNHVKLMTVHSAKGLEFPVVFVVGLEEGLFPSMMAVNSREDLEEERRLFYVAITRAQRDVMLTYSTMRFRFGDLKYCEASRFIDELGDDHVDFIGHRRQEPEPEPEPEPPQSHPHHRPGKKEKKPSGEAPVQEQKRKLTSLNKMQKKQDQDNGNGELFQADDASQLRVGAQVEHKKFGVGHVMQVEGNANNRIATIHFQNHGQKRVMLKFAKLKIK